MATLKHPGTLAPTEAGSGPVVFWRGHGTAVYWVLTAASFLAALAVDDLALWPFIMTPLYAVPILIAAHRLSPPQVGAVAALVVVVNVISAMVQGTPPEVALFYTLGLVAVAYLALQFAFQRQAAERQAQEAAEARARFQEFVGMATHDLRTPLTTLLGYLQLFRSRTTETMGESQWQMLGTIESATGRIRRLVDDLGDATAAGAGRFALRRVPVDLVPVVRQVVELQQASARDRRLTLHAPSALEGEWDQARIEQALGNLIANAVKYSVAGGEVKVALDGTADQARISVSDRGKGISPEQARTLFQPFFRLDGSAGMDGQGLGLYITRIIAEAHGGRVWVESSPEAGSTFWLTLPRAAAEELPQL